LIELQGTDRHAALASDLIEEFRASIIDSLVTYPVSRHTLGQVEVLGVGAPVTQAARSVVI